MITDHSRANAAAGIGWPAKAAVCTENVIRVDLAVNKVN
jgi:hypothetical protein